MADVVRGKHVGNAVTDAVRGKPVAAWGELLLNITPDINNVLTIKARRNQIQSPLIINLERFGLRDLQFTLILICQIRHL